MSFNLSPVFLKLLAEETVTPADLASLDALLYQNLQYVLSTDSVEELDLTFTASSHDISPSLSSSSSLSLSKSVIELEPGGASRAVTHSNRKRYVKLLSRYLTVGRMGCQAKRVREGMLSILPSHVLSLFTSAELGQLLCGRSQVDDTDWKNHTVYSGGWDRCHPVIHWFWDLVLSLSQEERALLLRFCTGASRLPSAGFSSLSPPFTICRVPLSLSLSSSSLPLPTASTCFNLLKLPEYQSEREMRRQVMTGLLLGSEGFSFT
mmetsp:Transcript_8027/g.8174  ORF Transcript_8027/g.8174 Transcript_8027/m.8174 type:complete len:264 (+) Transcript_8027:784-1575(+)